MEHTNNSCDTIIIAAVVIGCVLCGADEIEPPCQYFGLFSTVAERVLLMVINYKTH